jgi:hypothetical protein
VSGAHDKAERTAPRDPEGLQGYPDLCRTARGGVSSRGSVVGLDDQAEIHRILTEEIERAVMELQSVFRGERSGP